MLSTLKKPSAVIFDLDGTLLDSESVVKKLWHESMAYHGFELNDALHCSLLGRRLRDVDAILMQEFGPDCPISSIRSRVKTAYEQQVQAGLVTLKPGVIELLAFLDGHQIPRAIATSTGIERARQMVQLNQLGFQIITGGDEVEQGKPAPDIFIKSANRLGVDVQDCWAIEDSHSGVYSAKAAGMKVIMVPDLMPPLPEHAVIVDSLFEVLSQLRHW
jgi:HAD superfamily hydrolase (TIGR01509 family)